MQAKDKFLEKINLLILVIGLCFSQTLSAGDIYEKIFNYNDQLKNSSVKFIQTNLNEIQEGVIYFGEERIIEPPTSENALTGIAFGLTLKGYSVCLIHQRFDFALLSLDQLINTASKWKFMLGNEQEKYSYDDDVFKEKLDNKYEIMKILNL